jgi:hypothetical protein
MLIIDGKFGYGKDDSFRGKGRGEHRGNTYRRPYNRHDDQSEGISGTWNGRGRGRGRDSPRTNYKNIDRTRPKQGGIPSSPSPFPQSDLS